MVTQNMEVTRQWGIGYFTVFFTIMGLILIVHATHGNEKNGKVIFEEHCAECHGTKGDGRGAVGPYLEKTPADLLAQKTRAQTDQELFETVRYGIHLEMPSWEGVLKDEEIWKVVKYLRVLAPQTSSARE